MLILMSSAKNHPFFIVGAQRSGTTMLRLMLNQHSRLCVPFESVFIPNFYYRLHEYSDLGEPANMESLLKAIAADEWVQKGKLIPDPAKVLDRCPRDYSSLIDAIFTAYAHAQNKVRWGDKTPSYVLNIDMLWALFPGCRIIHLIRDGRDVSLSLAKLSWGSRDIIRNATDWRWKVMLGRKMGSMIVDNYLEIRYEELVSEPSKTLEGVCNFLGERFELEMLNYPVYAKQAMPTQSLQWHLHSISAPDSTKIFQWRTQMSLSDQIIFEKMAGDALDILGYERRQHKPTFASKVRFARYALLGRP